MRFPIDG